MARISRYRLPHTIDNGAGERLVFSRRVRGVRGDRLEAETTVQPGAGPPMHVHHLQDEGFTVLEGRLGYQRDGEKARFAGPGESVEFKAGEPHRFWNAGPAELRVAGYIEPANNGEYFLTELFDSMRRTGSGRPDLFDVAYLSQRYGREYSVLQIPRVVQRLAFPLLVFLGVALGLFDKYADSPAPIEG